VFMPYYLVTHRNNVTLNNILNNSNVLLSLLGWGHLPYRHPFAGRRERRPTWSGSGTGCRPNSSALGFAGRRGILVWASRQRLRLLWHRHLPGGEKNSNKLSTTSLADIFSLFSLLLGRKNRDGEKIYITLYL